MDSITKIIEEVKKWDEIPAFDYRAECAKQFPSDLYLMDDCHSQKSQEDRYFLIADMNRLYRQRYA